MIVLAGLTIIGMLICVYISMILALRHNSAWKYFVMGYVLFVVAFYCIVGVNNMINKLTVILPMEVIIQAIQGGSDLKLN